MLLKQGLTGEYKFTGKQGAFDFVRQAGCIQYDPVNVCGKNAELTLQSRVKDFTKDILDELLYKDRKLFDYPDKCLSIILTEDLPYFNRYRQDSRNHAKNYPEMKELINYTHSFIEKNGVVCSDDIKIDDKFYWHSAIHWSAGNNLSRSVLEQMYSTVDLIIHHKKGTRKYYDLAEKYISSEILDAPEPLPDDFEHKKWRVLRRIGAVGLIWNRPSDAWLYICRSDNQIRNKIFQELLNENKIIEISVDGLKDILYCQIEDMKLIEYVLQNPELKPRCELIAPLDCFMWDRKLIKSLFDFEYSWEIYTPPNKRKYGVYVLPMIFGENFIGRIDASAERKEKNLIIKNIWYENNIKQTKELKSAVENCLRRFAKFNECENIKFI
ncbi:MAG: winged helix DNA-binding domain-containing protein [Oscillospiraceae bacterium]|nr:winged helix DNA-binding domain-containing protein [Oscillospiraceae bacterium]